MSNTGLPERLVATFQNDSGEVHIVKQQCTKVVERGTRARGLVYSCSTSLHFVTIRYALSRSAQYNNSTVN